MFQLNKDARWCKRMGGYALILNDITFAYSWKEGDVWYWQLACWPEKNGESKSIMGSRRAAERALAEVSHERKREAGQ